MMVAMCHMYVCECADVWSKRKHVYCMQVFKQYPVIYSRNSVQEKLLQMKQFYSQKKYLG